MSRAADAPTRHAGLLAGLMAVMASAVVVDTSLMNFSMFPVVRDVEIPVSGVQSNRRREDPWTRCCRSAARVSSITIVEPVLKVDREGWPM